MKTKIVFVPPYNNTHEKCTGRRMIVNGFAKEVTMSDLSEHSIVLNPFAKKELKWLDNFEGNSIVILDAPWEKLKGLSNLLTNSYKVKARKLPANIITQNPFYSRKNNMLSTIEAAIAAHIILGDYKLAIEIAKTIDWAYQFIKKNFPWLNVNTPRSLEKNTSCFFRPLPLPHISITWEITRKCNLECYYCCTSSGPTGRHTIDYDEAKLIVKDLLLNGVGEIYFTGGEPLLYPKILNLLLFTRNTGIKVSMATNGTLIDEDTAKKLSLIGLDFCHISIDGFESEFDLIKGKGTCHKVLKGIYNLVKYSVPVRVGFMLSNENVEYVHELTKYLFRIGVERITYMTPLPVGRIENDSNRIKLSLIQIKKIKKELTNQYGSKVDFRWEEIENGNISDCPGGRNLYHINPEGYSYPCSWIEKTLPQYCLGNVRTESFGEIKKTAKYYRILLKSRLLANHHCKVCNLLSTCEGGCPIRSFMDSGSFFTINKSICPKGRDSQ